MEPEIPWKVYRYNLEFLAGYVDFYIATAEKTHVLEKRYEYLAMADLYARDGLCAIRAIPKDMLGPQAENYRSYFLASRPIIRYRHEESMRQLKNWVS